MTGWAEQQRDADAAWRFERAQAEQVQCPWCHKPAGETCWNSVTDAPLEKVPAHWQRMFAAAHRQDLEP